MNQSISFCLQRCWSVCLFYCRKLHGENGNAILEMAIIVAFLVPPLLLGTTDMAALIYGSIENSNAAHAGALYGSRSTTYAVDTADIITAAQAEAPSFGSKLNVTPTSYYVCSAAQDGAQYTTSSAATTACTGSSGSPLLFVKVLTTAPVSLPFRCCGMTSSVTLNGKSVMEVQGQ